MPLNRYLIRNEYNLADQKVYKVARKDDPEALLEGVTMAGLVGVLRQLGDLADFAAEIFHGLHEEVMTTAARRHDLIVRVQQLEAELPLVEKTLLSQTSHTAAFCSPGVDWHSEVRLDENVVTRRDLPRFVMDSYEDCRGPPQLFLLDKFDVAGAGACLKRFSDPSFFKLEPTDCSYTNSEAQREKKTRKTKRRGPRMRNGDASELIPSSHAQLYQLLSEDTESCGTDAERRVKLKKRPLDGFHRQEKSGQSYMQKFFDVCSPEHKFVHEISLDLVLMDPVSNMTPKSGLEIVETDMTIPYQEPSERNEETYSPSRVPDLVDKRSINEWIEVTNGKHAELSWENQGSHSDKILALLDKDINDEEELDAGSGRKSEGRGGESHSDDMSDSDSFEDALATMESEVETDTESRTKRDLHHPNLSKTTINSDGSDGQEYFNDPFSDFQSFGNSTMSDEGCVVKKGREKFSHSDTKGNIAESVPAQGKEAAGKSSGDLLPEQQSLSLVVGRTKTNDYVPCSTSDVSRVKVQLEEASPKSGKVGDTFAKTEIKWVKRCDEVSSDETVSSSLSSAEDPETCGQYSSPSQTDCTIHYSSPYLCDQINERNGSSDILLEEESLGCASVAEETPVSSHSLENSNYMDSKDDDHVSYLGKKSQGESLQADLGKEQGEAKNKIAGISYVLQLDVSQVPLPCSGDIADSSSVSKAEDEWKMRQTVPFTLGEETLKSRTYPAMDGQDLEENTRFVDQNEAQKPSTETICLLEPICSGETDAAQNLKIDPPEASVTGSDERISGIDCKAQSGLDVKESPNAICVEEARFGLTNETTENHEAHPASCQDRSDFPLCGGRDDKHPDVYVEAIEKDIYLDSSKDGTEEEKDLETPSVSPSKQDGTEEEKDLKTPSVSPSKHIIGSDYVLEEDNYLDMNHTAVGKVCGEVVVTGDLDEGIDDENADGSPLSSHLDHSPPLGPMEQHEEFYVEGSSQNGNKIPDMSPECPVKLEAQNDRSHTEDVPENSSSPLCGTISSSDPVSRVSDNGPSVFLADDVQANLYQRYLTEDKADHMDTSDNHDCTESLVATGEAEVPHAGKCPEEGSQALDLDQPVPSNLSVQFTNIDSESQPLEARFVVPSSSIPFQDQPSVAELLVEMVDHNPVIQHDMEPSTSVSPSGSVLPDQIRVNLNFNVSRLPSDASSGSPVLGVISDTSETKLDEAPPLPPLPPMQWRLGKNQQNASSMLETLGSEQQLATHQTDDYNLVGPQHWNPFASFSNEDSKFTNISTQGKLINHEAAVQDEELQHISPAGQQENTIPIDHIPSLPEEGNVNSSSQPVSPPTMQHGAQLQHGFITPEDQQAWSRSAFHAVDPGSGNGKTQKKPPRPRNPLIEEVVALDKSKLRKVGERVRHQDEPRAEDKQSLPKLRKVGERTKPKDTSEQLEQSLRRLRKVGERVKFSDEASFEGREQNHAQLQEVGERVELQDELPSEERGGQDNLKSEEREQSLPRLQKIGERVNLQGGLSIDNRDSLMEQIKNKTFSLKPTVTTRANIQGPQTNLKIAAILEKATTIRQAMAGSDEDDSDGWSDN